MSPRGLGSLKPNQAAVNLAALQFDPATATQDAAILSPAGGLRRELPSGKIPLTDIVEGENFLNDHGMWRVRDGVSHLGGVLTAPVIAVGLFNDSRDVQFIHAATTTGMYRITSAAWEALTGPVLHGSTGTEYSFAAWNGELIYANNADPVGHVNYTTKTYAALPGAPVGRVVTTFGGRIIVGGVANQPERVQWCVRNDNTDWLGLGSGYEDLLSTPGGVVDTVRGLFPVGDYKCLVIRTYSVWLMQTTGLVDAPFSFTKLYDIQGTVAPMAMVATPYGVLGLMRNGVYIFSDGNAPQEIGLPVREELLSQSSFRQASACYDPIRDDYVLNIPQASGSKLWRYHFPVQKWTKHTYPHRTFRVGFVLGQSVDAFSQLVGTFGAQTGTFAQWGVHGLKASVVFAAGIGSNYVLQEDPTVTADTSASSSATSPVASTLTTGTLTSVVPLNKIHLVEVALEYESARDGTFRIEISVDGFTWSNLGYGATVGAGTPSQVTRVQNPVQRSQIQLRISNADSIGVKLLSVWPRAAQGGKIAY